MEGIPRGFRSLFKSLQDLRGAWCTFNGVYLLGMLFIPVVLAAFAAWRFPDTITWKEFLLQLAVQTAFITGGYYIAKYQSLSSTEHLNGRIIAKTHNSESCCHCRTVCDARDKKGNCTSSHEVCDHIVDYRWDLKTSVGSINIDKCEPFAFNVPKVWAQARVGEPSSVEHSYQNYLKGDEQSLLVHKELDQFQVPPFPEIYGFYKVNPVMGPAPANWQDAFREINADLGASKQVDVTLLVTSVQDPTYAQAVEAQWLYGPKNSLNIVIGVLDGSITWARVVTISKVEDLKIYLRDELQGKKFTDDIPGIVRIAVKERFHRTAMAEYEYLARNATPSTGWLIGLYILGLLVAAGLSILMHRRDIFGEERRGFQFGTNYGRKYRR